MRVHRAFRTAFCLTGLSGLIIANLALGAPSFSSGGVITAQRSGSLLARTSAAAAMPPQPAFTNSSTAVDTKVPLWLERFDFQQETADVQPASAPNTAVPFAAKEPTSFAVESMMAPSNGYAASITAVPEPATWVSALSASAVLLLSALHRAPNSHLPPRPRR
jgi:hypothetical protein